MPWEPTLYLARSSERDSVYLHILHWGLLSIREAARAGHLSHCEIEAEHLHNLPSLIGEPNEHRHRYYFNEERTWYLERVDRSAPGIEFTLARYAELWEELGKLTLPAHEPPR